MKLAMDDPRITKPRNERPYAVIDESLYLECTQCLEWKDKDQFYRRWDGKGRAPHCKDCARAYAKRRYWSFAWAGCFALFVAGQAFLNPSHDKLTHRLASIHGGQLNAPPQFFGNIEDQTDVAGLYVAHAGNLTPRNKIILDNLE